LLGAHVLSYGGREHTKGSGYEVLTGDGFQWKTAEGGRVPQGAVQGGREADGTPLYVARGKVDGVDSIGKVNTSHNNCYLPYGGKEHPVKRYEVLVHSPPTSPPQGPSRTSQPQERPSSGVSGWGLLGIAAGAIAVGAAAAVVSSLHDDQSNSNSSSESDSDTTDRRAADKEDADLLEAIRQSLLLQPASPPHAPAPASDPSQDPASANAGRGPGSSAPPRGFSNSSSALPAPECIVCWDGLNPPKRIHQCVNGHFVCDDCRPQLQKCSLCRANFAGRATGMEQFLRDLHQKP